MNARTILAFLAVLGPLVAGDAAAQKLSLRIDKGLVTLDAENVTVDEVLARWIDTTGLNVVSKNGVGSDVPVSLHLEGVPEREALAVLLRDLSGYIMGQRRDPLTGIVTIDRLMILPQSAAQATASVERRTSRPSVQAASPPVELAPLAVPTPESEPDTFVLESGVELAPMPDSGPGAASSEVPSAPLRSVRPGTIVMPESRTAPLRITPRPREDAPQ
ncbi:MAG TPA: hypothetical protein VFD69_20410 [Vicinamibacterales bacterium]|nr:hypothetical protein [Vicinamibacterales bacterium]